MTHYEVLQVSEVASIEVINASWKALSRLHHPDVPGGSVEMSQRINEAHDVLSDPEKRAIYDTTLLRGNARAAGFGPHNPFYNRQGQASAQAFAGLKFDPTAYPDAYEGVIEDMPEILNEFGRNVAQDVGLNLLNQVLENVHPSLREHLAKAIRMKAANQGRRR